MAQPLAFPGLWLWLWYFAESSSTSNYNSVYYNDDGKSVEAGDMAKGGWSGTYAKNSAGLPTATGTTSAVASECVVQHVRAGAHAAGSGGGGAAGGEPGAGSWWQPPQQR